MDVVSELDSLSDKHGGLFLALLIARLCTAARGRTLDSNVASSSLAAELRGMNEVVLIVAEQLVSQFRDSPTPKLAVRVRETLSLMGDVAPAVNGEVAWAISSSQAAVEQ